MYIDERKKDGRKEDGRTLDGRKKDGREMCRCVQRYSECETRHAAQCRLGRCSFALTVSTAHYAAIDQLPGMVFFCSEGRQPAAFAAAS